MLGDDLGDSDDVGSSPQGKRLALIGAGTVLLGLGLALAYGIGPGLWVGAGLHLPLQGKVKHQAAPAENFYYLDPLILNGTESEDDVTSYVRLTLTLELDRPEMKGELQARLPAIQDAVMTAAASRESRALRTAQGKALLRDELTDRINALLPNGGVKAVYFADFYIE